MKMKKISCFIGLCLLLGACTSYQKNAPSSKTMSIGMASRLGLIKTIYAPLPAGTSPSGYISLDQIIRSFSASNPQSDVGKVPVTFVNQFNGRILDPVTNGSQSLPIADLGEWYIRVGGS